MHSLRRLCLFLRISDIEFYDRRQGGEEEKGARAVESYGSIASEIVFRRSFTNEMVFLGAGLPASHREKEQDDDDSDS